MGGLASASPYGEITMKQRGRPRKPKKVYKSNAELLLTKEQGDILDHVDGSMARELWEAKEQDLWREICRVMLELHRVNSPFFSMELRHIQFILTPYRINHMTWRV